MKHRLLFLFSQIVVCISCSNEIATQLDKAQSYLSEEPDHALAILDSIHTSQLNSPKVIARFALLMSAALDKNYIDIQSDSLIKKAVDYYSHTRSHQNKMLSWYYQGVILKNAKEYAPSIIALEKSEKEAEILEDNLYLGLIYRNIASVYSLTNNIPASVEYRKKAICFFEKANAQPYKDYAELALANDLSSQKDNLSANLLLDSLLLRSDDSLLRAQCYIRKASLLVKQGKKPETAIGYYQNQPRSLFGLLDYAHLAQAFEMVGIKDSADYWLNEGYLRCMDTPDSASLDYLKSRIEIKRGHYEEAYRLVDHASSVQDSLTRILLNQSVSMAQRDYYKNESLLREEMFRAMRQRVLFGIVTGVLLASLLSIIFLTRSRKKDHQLQEQMARLALEERELERVNRDNAHLVGSLFSEKIDHLDTLSESYFKMDEGKEKETLFKQIKQTVSSLRKDQGMFLSLEKDLDRYCNGIMSKLRDQVPRISGDNRRIIALFFAGYSYEAVKLILNKVSVESLKTARSRFRKEIKESGAPDTDFFLKMLEMKKRPQAGTNESNRDC